MANPKKSASLFAGAGGKPMIGEQVANIPDYTITWSANEPTAGDSQTIADGDTPTVAETGQAIADLTAKLNLILAALETHGFMADS
jgi:hypothetical protein